MFTVVIKIHLEFLQSLEFIQALSSFRERSKSFFVLSVYV